LYIVYDLFLIKLFWSTLSDDSASITLLIIISSFYVSGLLSISFYNSKLDSWGANPDSTLELSQPDFLSNCSLELVKHSF
jgi:hypothetical protein